MRGSTENSSTGARAGPLPIGGRPATLSKARHEGSGRDRFAGGPEVRPGSRLERLRVIIVADVRLYREGLAALIGRRDEIDIVASATSREVPDLDLATLAPHVVLWDVSAHDDIDELRDLVAAENELRVLVIAVAELEREIVRLAEAGMAAYVTRDADSDELVRSIHGLAAGEARCSPRVTATLLRRIAVLAKGMDEVGAHELTPREAQIVGYLRQGLSNKEIAVTLTVEVSTVKNHVHNLLEKLGVHRRSEVAARLRRLPAVGPIGSKRDDVAQI